MNKVKMVKKRKSYSDFFYQTDGIRLLEKQAGLAFEEGENCEIRSNRLCYGVGLQKIRTITGEDALAPSGVKLSALCAYPTEAEGNKVLYGYFALDVSGVLWRYDPVGLQSVPVGETTFDSFSALFPVYTRDEPFRMAVVGATGVYTVDASDTVTPICTDEVAAFGAFFHGRIFFVSGNSLRYSVPYQFVEFTDGADEGGSIELGAEGGSVRGLVCAGEKVLVVRENAILEVDARGAARDFTVKRLQYCGGKVLTNTVCAVGEAVFFLADDGVYRLESGKAERVMSGFPRGAVFEREFRAAENEGKYYLAYYDWAAAEPKTLVVDRDGKSYYYAFGVELLAENPAGAYALLDGAVYQLCTAGVLPGGEKSYAVARNLDFGFGGEKVLRKLRLFGFGEVTVTVRSERGKRTLAFSLSGAGEKELSLKCRTAELEFSFARHAAVEKIELEYDLIGGEKRV